MPYDVEFTRPLVGFALNSVEVGENLKAIVTDFATDEQGRAFYNYLENLEELFLKPYLVEGCA